MKRLGLSQALLAAAISAAALVAGQAQASTIVLADNFSGTGALNGRAPSTPQTAGDVWTDASSSFTISSSGTLAGSSGNSQAAQLPFNLTPGAVYDLSADIRSTAAWVGIGFQQGSSSGAVWPGNGVAPWAFVGSNGENKAFASDATADEFIDAWLGGNSHHVDITLDTSAPHWVVSVTYDNGATPNGTFTYATNPSIDHVAIVTAWSAAGEVTNLSLTASSVPEPATLSVLGLAAWGLLSRRSHKAC